MRPPRKRRFVLLGALLLPLLGTAGYGVFALKERYFPSLPSDPKELNQVLAQKSAEDEAKARVARQAERNALNKERVRTLLDRGEALLQRAAELESEDDKWHKSVEPLLASSDGKYLAATRDTADSFSESFKKERPGRKDAMAIRKRLDSLLQPLRTQWEESNFASPPSGELTDELDRIGDELRDSLARAREPRLEIEGLLAAAKQSGTKGERTLEEAVQFYTAQDAKRRNDDAARIREEVRREYEERERKMAEEAERDRQEAELRLATAKKRSEVKAIDDQASTLQRDADRAELVKRARSPATKRLLAFFLTPGLRQPDGSMTTQKMPISLSKLRAAGALEDSPTGLNRLRWVLVDFSEKVRPVPKDLEGSVLVSAHIEKLKKMQDALNELGDVLVELKMLAE